MSHHEVLDAAAKGTNVILSDHSNSERGYLAVFREKLAVRLPDSMTVVVSKADRDPLEVVWKVVCFGLEKMNITEAPSAFSNCMNQIVCDIIA